MNSKSIALFDIDKTIYDGHIILPLIDLQNQAGLLTKTALDQLYGLFKQYVKGELDYETCIQSILKVWADGLKDAPYTEVVTHVTNYLEHEGNKFYPFAVDLFNILKPTHDIYLITGEPQFIGQAVQKRFSVTGYISSIFEVRNHKFTGNVLQSLATRQQKENVIKETLAKYNLKHSFAFGDSEADLNMLSLVEHPICINPSDEVTKVATEKRWSIVNNDSIVNQVKAYLN